MIAYPGNYKIRDKQGATIYRVFTWSVGAIGGPVVNLTGFAAKLQIRDASGVAVVTLTDTTGIVLGGVLGTIAITIAASVTATMPVGEYTYDLRLTDSLGAVGYLLEGVVSITPRVTQ